MSGKWLLIAAVTLASLPAWTAERQRDRENFDTGWKFLKGDAANAERPHSTIMPGGR